MMRLLFLILCLTTFLMPTPSSTAIAAGKYEINDRDPKPADVDTSKCPQKGCDACSCEKQIQGNHKTIRAHMTDEFIKHRDWMIDTFFKEHVLPAMALMTVQLETVAMSHTYAIGKFFDAKHQLETQTILQKMMADANKSYQPSEGICTVGTSARSLAQSSRKGNLAHIAFADRIMKRQLLNKDVLSAGLETDLKSRINLFAEKHCDVKDNANGLNWLCKNSSGPVDRRNKDVDFTRMVDSRLTIDADFYEDDVDNPSPDEEDIFALTSNLFGSEVNRPTDKLILADKNGVPKDNAYTYLDLRSVLAKRSVAQNSVSAIIAEKSNGDPEVAKFLKRIVADLGVKEDEIDTILGENPSYFAQMEVLTKDIYQNPTFYTELYDKPANVLRKSAMIRALSLMQERDLYRSQLRNEATLAVMLETMLHREQTDVNARLGAATPKEN